MDARNTRHAGNTPDATNRWVEDRLRVLDPPDTFEPATNIALARFRERAAAAATATTTADTGAASRRGWRTFGNFRWQGWGSWGSARRWAAALSTCLVLALMITPGTRSAAQRLWDVFFAERVEFVRLDLDKLPRSLTEQHIRMVGAHQEVASAEEAARYVGFTPRLPDPSIVSIAAIDPAGQPRFHAAGAISVESRVNVLDLEAAARAARVSDVHFPRTWDGASIAIHSSPIAVAEYPAFTLAQVMPLAITTPPEFDLGAFTEQVLRIGGLAPDEARTFAARMHEAPFALVGLSAADKTLVREVRLRTGQGTVVHELDEYGNLQRSSLVWSTADRLYTLSAKLTDDDLIAIANAIPD